MLKNFQFKHSSLSFNVELYSCRIVTWSCRVLFMFTKPRHVYPIYLRKQLKKNSHIKFHMINNYQFNIFKILQINGILNIQRNKHVLLLSI